MLPTTKVLTFSTAFLFMYSLPTLAITTSDTPTYSNFYISYVAPKDVQALGDYAQQNKLAGYILWPLDGDVTASDNDSLLAALKPKAQGQTVSAYWMDWSVYSTTNPYPVPGSFNKDTDSIVSNPDFTGKLQYLTNITYAFLEAQAQTYTYTDEQGISHTVPNKTPEHIGTLYFNDPWSDLAPKDSFCSNNPICTYTYDEKPPADPPVPFDAATKMNNFGAFAKLKSASLETTISVGGYAHDDTFEATFTNEHYMDNFVGSAVSVLNNYNISGIDLDYENPNMTHAQSQSFEHLVSKLSAALPVGKYITVTILSNPKYLNGTENSNTVGFAENVLANIAALPNVRAINLMTYDFHGAFDYVAQPTESNPQGKTGFLSNLYMPNNTPEGYDAKFSVDTSVKTLLVLHVPASKIGVGIPAYGRSLANITAGKDGTGLFSTLTSNTVIPVGDLDQPGCSSSLPLNSNSCSGSFSYKYIVNTIMSSPQALTKDWQDGLKNVFNGTTTFVSMFNPPAGLNYTLQAANTGRGAAYAGLQIIVTDGTTTFTSDYLGNADGNDKTYSNTNPAINSLEGGKGLTVKWITWAGGPAGTCPGTLDFTSNSRIMVRVNTSQVPVIADCAITHP